MMKRSYFQKSSHQTQALRRKSMSIAEEDAYQLTFDEIMDELERLYEDEEENLELHHWVRKVLEYNVPGGKQIRGRAVVAAYRALVDEPDHEELKLCYVLGWCVEIFQAAFLTADDIIDRSETRRGKPCWYLVEDNGDMAINDAFILTGTLNQLLDNYFSEKPYYTEVAALFNDIYLKTSLGQAMDIETSKGESLDRFTMNQYKRIVYYKTCYYTFFLPVACAMVMVGRTNRETLSSVEDLVLEIGLLFQVQDDFLDCYGDPEVTGKVGTDVAENKCSWLIVTAMGKADEKQKKVLEENYGKGQESTPKNEAMVASIFHELKIKEEYRKFEEQCYNSIMEKIEKLGDKLPTALFQETAEVIYHRNR